MSILADFAQIWHKIEISNQELNKVINEYSFFYVSKELNREQDDSLFQILRFDKYIL